MEGATWAAFGLSLLSMVGTVAAAMNARQVARDKLEFERISARDKLEFDAKSRDMELRLAVVQGELTACREQHKSSEADIAQMRAELNDLRSQVAKLKGA